MTEHGVKAIPTGRDADGIIRDQGYNFSLEAFEGKTILDIGCGYSDLQADLERRNVGARVVGIDVRLDVLDNNQVTSMAPYAPVVATGSHLPFTDNSFDVVLATYSLPMWASSAEQIDSFFREAGRVLRAGGLLAVSPTTVSIDILKQAGVAEFHALTLATQLAIRDLVSDINWFEISHEAERLTALKVS